MSNIFYLYYIAFNKFINLLLEFQNYPNYEVLQDVKGQVMFLQELDRIEKRKHEEQEREVLIKAAKVCLKLKILFVFIIKCVVFVESFKS